MSDDVIEPSEIFVEQRKGTVNEDTVHVNPWLRLVARFFDYSLFFLLLLLLRHFFGGHLPFGRYEYLVPFEYFVWIPFEAILLYTWGTTPGKWFLRIKLRHGAKKKPDFMTALKRSFHVWFRGLGMGIPVVNFICLLVAYHRLKVYRKTSWDRDDHIVVTHAPMASWRFFAAAVIAIVGLLFYFHEKREEIASFSIKTMSIYSFKPNNWFLTTSALPHIFCLHFGSCLSTMPLVPAKKSEDPPCQIPNSSFFMSIHV